MHGSRPNSSLIGPVFPSHGLWFSPVEDPAGRALHLPQRCPTRPTPNSPSTTRALLPPLTLTPAAFHMTRPVRPPGPRTPCSRRVNASAPVCGDAAFSCTWNKRRLYQLCHKKRAFPQYLALQLTRCYVIMLLLLSLDSFHYSTSLLLAASSLSSSFFFCESHHFSEQLSWTAGEKISCQLSLLPSRLIFFPAASAPALQPR